MNLAQAIHRMKESARTQGIAYAVWTPTDAGYGLVLDVRPVAAGAPGKEWTRIGVDDRFPITK